MSQLSVPEFMAALLSSAKKTSRKADLAKAFSSQLDVAIRVLPWRRGDWGELVDRYSGRANRHYFGDYAPLGVTACEHIYARMCRLGKSAAARSFEASEKRPRFAIPEEMKPTDSQGLPCLYVGRELSEKDNPDRRWSVTSVHHDRVILCRTSGEGGPKRKTVRKETP